MKVHVHYLCLIVLSMVIGCKHPVSKQDKFPWSDFCRFTLNLYESNANTYGWKEKIGVFFQSEPIGTLEASVETGEFQTTEIPLGSMTELVEEQEWSVINFAYAMNDQKSYQVGLFPDFLDLGNKDLNDQEMWNLVEDLHDVGVVYAFSVPQYENGDFLICIWARYFVGFEDEHGKLGAVSDISGSNDEYMLVSCKKVNGTWRFSVIQKYVPHLLGD